MFNPRKHRWLSTLLLAAYVAASSASALWHHHAGAAAGHDHARCEHDHEAHLDEHDSGTEHHCHYAFASDDSPQQEQPAGKCVTATHDADHCAICRFVGQRVIPTASPQLAASGEFFAPVVTAEPIQCAAQVERTTHPRAPPRVG